jgi:hypothetical protein
MNSGKSFATRFKKNSPRKKNITGSLQAKKLVPQSGEA